MDKINQADELLSVNKELIFQNQENVKLEGELVVANKELVFQTKEKENRAAELILANIELDFQNTGKDKRGAELLTAKIELDQDTEKEKLVAELIIAYEEKARRAAELVIANEELVFQNIEKEKRAAELIIANNELLFQNREKEKRAAELSIANKELLFQNQEKEKRAAELVIANKELVFQNKEKEKRAEAEAKKDEFLNLVSHELKTPLTSIKAINQLLEKTADKTNPHYAFIVKSKHNIKRLERLIDDMLDVTKINSGKADLVIAEFNFDDMLTHSLSSVQQITASHQIILQNSINIVYKGDQFRIEQVIINLLNNAIKYSPQADKVLVSVTIADGHLVVCIQDFGIGIAKEDIKQLFDRFFRVNEIALNYQGLGLGLYIASEIIKNHGGDFNIESEPGTGSRFSFRLPLNATNLFLPSTE